MLSTRFEIPEPWAPRNLIFKPSFLKAYRVGAHDAVDRKAIDSFCAMTLQSHATSEVLARPGFVSSPPHDFDPFAHRDAALDGAVNKCNLSIGKAQCFAAKPPEPQAQPVRSMLYFF